MNIFGIRIAATTAIWLALAACAPQTEVVKLYDTAKGSRHYDRLLVIDVASNADARLQFEDLVAGELRRIGAGAVAGHTHTGPKTTLTQAEINDAARKAGADGILITHIASVTMASEREEGRTNVVAECRGGDLADYFLYDYEELKEPDSVRFAHTVVVVTNLYDAASGDRIWTIQSTCFEKASLEEALADEAGAIARQLRIDGLAG
ncbi:MAG: hypothetical protein OEV41_07070 [Gammaproteobacteria bacterium]|nr:hypothetical protein [Gammaproteobacteria bacterium]